MNFVVWHRSGSAGIAASRRVLRAAEVPLFAEAQQLRDALEKLRDEQAQVVAAAADEARAAGYAQGLEEGRRAARDEVAERLAEIALAGEHERAQLRGEIAVLALQVARKLLGEFADAERLVALAATAAQDLLPAQTLTLAVHPDRAEATRGCLAAATASGRPLPRFEVRADPDCAPGDCRIETEHGRIDASLDAQLQRLAAAWGLTQGEAQR
jgi:type III secretion system HrpE/YscL family protein